MHALYPPIHFLQIIALLEIFFSIFSSREFRWKPQHNIYEEKAASQPAAQEDKIPGIGRDSSDGKPAASTTNPLGSKCFNSYASSSLDNKCCEKLNSTCRLFSFSTLESDTVLLTLAQQTLFQL